MRARLHLVGHSSGAHLAAALCVDPRSAPMIASALLLSGVYELEPVRRSARRQYLSIDDEACASLSPLRHAARLRMPVTVAVGADESPEFRRQAHAFAQAADAALHEAAVLDHFEIVESLADPYGTTGRLLWPMLAEGATLGRP
jgi:arylformamidase